ncbi:hypothetical protein NL676_007362 [Syzygium grande]|nr:hypothetical protein NL676_007362 [Syzygium grande]
MAGLWFPRIEQPSGWGTPRPNHGLRCSHSSRRYSPTIASAESESVDGVWVLARARVVEPIMCRHVVGERAEDGVVVLCIGAVRREVSYGVVAEFGMMCRGSDQNSQKNEEIKSR